jgi:hypothetical protein
MANTKVKSHNLANTAVTAGGYRIYTFTGSGSITF